MPFYNNINVFEAELKLWQTLVIMVSYSLSRNYLEKNLLFSENILSISPNSQQSLNIKLHLRKRV